MSVIRKADLHFGPGPQQATLVESPQDRFDMAIKPDSADNRLSRLEFSWRSPISTQERTLILMSNFALVIDQLSQAQGNLSCKEHSDDYDGAARVVAESGLYAFGEGDPLLAACESSTIVVTGAV